MKIFLIWSSKHAWFWCFFNKIMMTWGVFMHAHITYWLKYCLRTYCLAACKVASLFYVSQPTSRILKWLFTSAWFCQWDIIDELSLMVKSTIPISYVSGPFSDLWPLLYMIVLLVAFAFHFCFQFSCLFVPYCAIQIQMTHLYQTLHVCTRETERNSMNWPKNGQRSMPCNTSGVL